MEPHSTVTGEGCGPGFCFIEGGGLGVSGFTLISECKT